MKTIVGHCPKCGAPIYGEESSPDQNPKVLFTCGCRFQFQAPQVVEKWWQGVPLYPYYPYYPYYRAPKYWPPYTITYSTTCSNGSITD